MEAVIKILKHILKAKLEVKKRNWVSSLPNVLWAYRTTTRNSMGETPLALAFGTQAVIPSVVAIPGYRTSQVIIDDNDGARKLDLDILEEH